jgi:hypothetical protein
MSPNVDDVAWKLSTTDEVDGQGDQKVRNIVEEDAPYLMKDGRPVVQLYDKNKDLTLVFGEKDGRVVIKAIDTPQYYDQSVVANYIKNTRLNNSSHNCQICKKQEEMRKKMLSRVRQVREQRAPAPVPPEPAPEPAPEPEVEPQGPQRGPLGRERGGFIAGNGAARRPFGGAVFDFLDKRPKPIMDRIMQRGQQ